MNPELVETAASAGFPLLWKRWHPLILGTVIFLFVLGVGHYFISLEARRIATEQHADMLDYAARLRLRLIEELGNVLYLSSGLSSYLAVRHKSLNSDEITEILSRLYSETRHVRNFGIAVGTTLTYVYPVKGNEAVIGSEIGKRVPQTMRAVDTVGRWGGDEFVVILQDIERQRVPEVADRIRESVGLPIPYGSQTLQVGAAIGIAIDPDDGKLVAELLRLADQRMYRSKPQRRNDSA